jgi:peptidoglycan/LPS O-acetylase OafA/YrhL
MEAGVPFFSLTSVAHAESHVISKNWVPAGGGHTMPRISQLDGLRGMAILLVFLYHAFTVFSVGWCGVDLFFVLSGYLITGVLLRLKEKAAVEGKSYWLSFYSRRAIRILPPYLAFLCIAGLLFRVSWTHVWYWYAFFGANFANALHREPSGVMVPLWSLGVEEQFYFVWPLILLLANRQTVKRIALVIMVAAPVLRAVCTPLFSSNAPIYCLTIFRADTLACGAFIALCEHENPAWPRLQRRLGLTCALVFGILFVALSGFRSFRLHADSVLFNSIGFSMIVLIFGGTLVYVLGATEGIIQSALAMKPLRYLGLISYTFYLYHVGVLDLVRGHVHSTTLSALLAFAITGALAAASWKYFESPILHWRRSPAQIPRQVIGLAAAKPI